MKQIRIGIDPDLEESGIAIIEQQPFGKQTITHLSTMYFFNMLSLINELYMKGEHKSFLVVVEAAHKIKVSNWHGSANKQIAGRIGKNIGENHAVAKLIIEYLKINQIPFREYVPGSKKWDADLFKKVTGYTKRTNQEERDAVRAAWL